MKGKTTPTTTTDWREQAAESINSQAPVDADYALVQRTQKLYGMLVGPTAPVQAGDGAIAKATILAALIAASRE